ncbi:hypothetical protein EMN47_17610 [Prolixibacteraceae bacterium JC049]|nr:hypothetical protein [Prolixibacteraceae bacterium JC049]
MRKFFTVLTLLLISVVSFGQKEYKQSFNKKIIEFGYQIGFSQHGMDRIKFDIKNNYQMNPYLSLGFGTGLRYYYSQSDILIPVFANLKTNFSTKSISPYFSFIIGYSFLPEHSFEGAGIIVNPAIGIDFKISNTSTNVGIGYEIQHRHVGYLNESNIYKNSNAISIHIGISL